MHSDDRDAFAASAALAWGQALPHEDPVRLGAMTQTATVAWPK